MDSFTQKIETLLGILALVGVIAGFLLLVFLGLPKQADIDKSAHKIPLLPETFFTNNTITKQIGELSVPAGIPVTTDPNIVGRDNAFKKF